MKLITFLVLLMASRRTVKSKFLKILLMDLMLALPALAVRGQSIDLVYSFPETNSANPYAGLTLGPDGNLYGTAESGGASIYQGMVFRVTTNGDLTTLVEFNGTNGANPYASLTLGPDGNLYGTTYYGGSNNDNAGTVYMVTTNGLLTTLWSFNGVLGCFPYGGLTLGPGGVFYGTTTSQEEGYGTVFRLMTNQVLMTFGFEVSSGYPGYYNSYAGRNPLGNLVLGPDGYLYGTTEAEGYFEGESVFKMLPENSMTTNGLLTTNVIFTTLGFTNINEGTAPYSGLTLGPDGNLYGTTSTGGTNKWGTIYRVTTNGVFTVLEAFNGIDGANPYAGLTVGPDGNLYGTTARYGSDSDGYGMIYKITTNGILTILAAFDGTNGAIPYGNLTLGPDGNFYGTTPYGGNVGEGSVYRLNLPPEILTGPASQSVTIGSGANFMVSLFGTAPYTYQWLSNSVPIVGATNAELTIATVLTNAMAGYQVFVTNNWGSVTSSVANLTVSVGPNIYGISKNGSNMMLSLANAPGSTNYLLATTNLSLPLAQWLVISTNVAGANGLFQFTDTNTGESPLKYYRLSSP
jgi:uncharacterized repeat protein (TIGR03803 family)